MLQHFNWLPKKFDIIRPLVWRSTDWASIWLACDDGYVLDPKLLRDCLPRGPDSGPLAVSRWRRCKRRLFLLAISVFAEGNSLLYEVWQSDFVSW